MTADVLQPLAWWGLGTPSQLALSWLAAERKAQEPYASDLPALRGLAARGFATVDEHGAWSITDRGRAVLAQRDNVDATWPTGGAA